MRRIRPPALRRNSSTTLGVIEPLEGRVHLAVHAVFLARAIEPRIRPVEVLERVEPDLASLPDGIRCREPKIEG